MQQQQQQQQQIQQQIQHVQQHMQQQQNVQQQPSQEQQIQMQISQEEANTEQLPNGAKRANMGFAATPVACDKYNSSPRCIRKSMTVGKLHSMMASMTRTTVHVTTSGKSDASISRSPFPASSSNGKGSDAAVTAGNDTGVNGARGKAQQQQYASATRILNHLSIQTLHKQVPPGPVTQGNTRVTPSHILCSIPTLPSAIAVSALMICRFVSTTQLHDDAIQLNSSPVVNSCVYVLCIIVASFGQHSCVTSVALPMVCRSWHVLC